MTGIYRVRHDQTHMYVACRERPRSEAFSAKSNGAATGFKWVRTAEEAETFASWSDADMVLIFLHHPKASVVDLCDQPVSRAQAEAAGNLFSHQVRA